MIRLVKVRARISIQGVVQVQGRDLAECEAKAVEAVTHTCRFGSDGYDGPKVTDVEIVDVEADALGPGGETR